MEERIAIAIDADNISPYKISSIINEIEKLGVITVKRAFGNFSNENLKPWLKFLDEFSIKPITHLSGGKNATDIYMTIDTMKLIYEKEELTTFVLVSSDRDFNLLVQEIKSSNKTAIGVLESKATASYKKCFSSYITIEDLASNKKEEFNEEKLLKQLSTAVLNSIEEENGIANIAKVGSILNNEYNFNLKMYGYKTLSDLLRSFKRFEVISLEDKTNYVYFKKKYRFNKERKD